MKEQLKQYGWECSISGSWWLLPDYMYLSKLSRWYTRKDKLCLNFFKKEKGEKVIWEHMGKIMNGYLQESKWEREM